MADQYKPLNEPRHIEARRAAGLTGCMNCRDTGVIPMPSWICSGLPWSQRREGLYCLAPGCNIATRLFEKVLGASRALGKTTTFSTDEALRKPDND